jgi:hypothetical protein
MGILRIAGAGDGNRTHIRRLGSVCRQECDKRSGPKLTEERIDSGIANPPARAGQSQPGLVLPLGFAGCSTLVRNIAILEKHHMVPEHETAAAVAPMMGAFEERRSQPRSGEEIHNREFAFLASSLVNP